MANVIHALILAARFEEYKADKRSRYKIDATRNDFISSLWVRAGCWR